MSVTDGGTADMGSRSSYALRIKAWVYRHNGGLHMHAIGDCGSKPQSPDPMPQITSHS